LLVSEKGPEIRGSQVHLHPPSFPDDSGVIRMSPDKYKDKDARIMAWQRLPGYPLVSYVGLSEADMLAAQAGAIHDYRQFAQLCSLLFLLMATIGVWLSLRNASRKRQAEEIRQAYQLAIDEAREGFFTMRAVYDSDNNLQDFILEGCNSRGASMTGYSKTDIAGRKLSELSLLQPFQTALPTFEQAMKNGFCEDEFETSAPSSGTPLWIQRRLIRFGSGLAVTLRDITESRENQRLLIKSANTDALTGLPNRYWLLNSLPALLHAAQARNS